MAHLPSRKAAAILGLHPNTLRSYANKGKIPHYRNAAGQRLYDVDALDRLGHSSLTDTQRYVELAGSHHEWVSRL